MSNYHSHESHAEFHKTLDSVVKVRCTNIECGWSIIWHQFGMWIGKNDLKCEKCGADAVTRPARRSEVCRLGVTKYATPESKQTHYSKDRILRKVNIF